MVTTKERQKQNNKNNRQQKQQATKTQQQESGIERPDRTIVASLPEHSLINNASRFRQQMTQGRVT